MTRRSTWWTLLGVSLVAGAVGIVWRHSFVAALAAFRNPTLVAGPPAATPTVAASFDGDLSGELDRQLARDFLEVGGQELLVDEDAELGDLTPDDLPLPVTRRALRYLRFFTRDARGRRTFEQIYRRSGRYRGTIETALREALLPTGLVWVVAAESGFDPEATSTAKAVGLWQLMPATARSYGLRIDAWVDQRRNVTRSTEVALRHLRKLHDALGDWDLALAAYNLGEDRLASSMARLRAIRQARGEAPARIRLADLAQEQLIPRETADYVPKVTALALAASNLQRFSFSRVEPDPSLHGSAVLVPSETRLSTIAKAAGISVEQLRALNPELLAEAVPPGGEHEVLIPAASHSRALATLPVYLDAEAREAEGLSDLEMADLNDPLETRTPDGATAFALPPAPAELMLSWLDTVRLAQPLGAGPWLPGSRLGMPGSLGTSPTGASPLDGLGGLPLYAWHDTLGVFRRGAISSWPASKPSRAPRDLHIEAQLAFLDRASTIEEAVGHGIVLRMEPNSATPRVAVGVRLGGDDATDAPTALGRGAELRVSEVVDPDQLDVAVSLALGQLGLMLAETADEPLGALRSQLNRHRRVAIGKLPAGEAWLALADAMFPQGEPSFGQLLDPRGVDGEWLRDRHLLATAAGRRAGRAVITVAGPFEPEHARALVTRALAQLGLGMPGARRELAHTQAQRQHLLLAVPHRKLLYGWRAPGMDETGHVAAMVTLEILAGRKKSLLARELVDAQLAAQVVARWDADWVTSAATVEITPAMTSQQERIERRVDELIRRLADEGPTRVELAYAQAMVQSRLRHRRERIRAPRGAHNDLPPSAERVLEVLRPDYDKRLSAAVDRVDARSVERAAQQVFAAEQRFVVEVRPLDDPGEVARR